MFCKWCGNELDNEAIFCGKCGERISDDNKSPFAVEKSIFSNTEKALDSRIEGGSKKSGMGTVSLVIGIVSLFILIVVAFLDRLLDSNIGSIIFLICIFTNIVGLVLGCCANKRKKTKKATAGIVLSIIGFVLALFLSFVYPIITINNALSVLDYL